LKLQNKSSIATNNILFILYVYRTEGSPQAFPLLESAMMEREEEESYLSCGASLETNYSVGWNQTKGAGRCFWSFMGRGGRWGPHDLAAPSLVSNKLAPPFTASRKKWTTERMAIYMIVVILR
jgi:hypothetical protein